MQYITHTVRCKQSVRLGLLELELFRWFGSRCRSWSHSACRTRCLNRCRCFYVGKLFVQPCRVKRNTRRLWGDTSKRASAWRSSRDEGSTCLGDLTGASFALIHTWRKFLPYFVHFSFTYSISEPLWSLRIPLKLCASVNITRISCLVIFCEWSKGMRTCRRCKAQQKH